MSKGKGGVLRLSFSVDNNNFNGSASIDGKWDRADAKLWLGLVMSKHVDEIVDVLEDRGIIAHE